MPLLAALLAVALAAAPAIDAGSPDAGFAPSVFPGSDADPALTAEIDRALALRREYRHLEALEALDSVRKQALQQQRLPIATNALNRRGDVLHDLRRDAEAEDAYQEAYEESEKRGDAWAMGRAAHDLALLSGVYSPDAKALEWFKKALEARRKARDYAGIRVTAHNLANAYRDEGDLATAEPYYEEAIQAAETIKDTYNQGRMSLLYANLLLETGEKRGDRQLLEKGRTWLSKAIVAIDAQGLDASRLCGHLEATQQRRCERHWPLDTPQARFAHYTRESAKLEPELARQPNGFPPPELLLRGARASLEAAKALRELGPDRAAQAATLEREARARLMDSLANRGPEASLGMLCGAQDVRELCERAGLVRRP